MNMLISDSRDVTVFRSTYQHKLNYMRQMCTAIYFLISLQLSHAASLTYYIVQISDLKYEDFIIFIAYFRMKYANRWAYITTPLNTSQRERIQILTLSIVVLDTGTNFPAVRVNSLLAMAVMKTRQRWKETGIPTQSHLHAASLTLSA
jgi:hypothetical protein